MDSIRINKYIAGSGVCSRRNADEIIVGGRVKINGQVVESFGTKVQPNDIVEVDGKVISLEENKVYIMLNKPKGYITTSKEQFNRPSVLDLVKVNERIFSVGRLDMDSEGLLILTNDGELANKIVHPTKHVSKKYEVELLNEITDTDLDKLRAGVDIGGYITKPATVSKLNNKKIVMTISEGKNRQIRRMCEAVNNKVISLKRVEIGALGLDALKPGQYRILSLKEVNKVFK